jgi:hypothetical protein
MLWTIPLQTAALRNTDTEMQIYEHSGKEICSETNSCAIKMETKLLSSSILWTFQIA